MDEFYELWEHPTRCCDEQLEWSWDEEHFIFKAKCSCMHLHTLEPTDAIYECEENEG